MPTDHRLTFIVVNAYPTSPLLTLCRVAADPTGVWKVSSLYMVKPTKYWLSVQNIERKPANHALIPTSIRLGVQGTQRKPTECPLFNI